MTDRVTGPENIASHWKQHFDKLLHIYVDCDNSLSGFCTLKSIIFNKKLFSSLKFHIYTYLKSKNFTKKIKKFFGGGGCVTPPNVPKLGVSGVKDTAKTNKDLGMSCYIQVEYSVLFRW